jgi:5-methylcytosine-specific restriction protein A
MAILNHKHRLQTPEVKRISYGAKDLREAASRRGYGAAWRQLRANAMASIALSQGWPYALCETHLKRGERVKASDLDHKVSRKLGGTDEPNNLQALCHSCHSRKTAKEDGGFKNRRKKKC